MSDAGHAADTSDDPRAAPDRPERDDRDLVLGRLHLGLSMVSAALPHLSGLARQVQLVGDPRMEVAAVTTSGRLLYNPGVMRYLPAEATAFVLAHELLHLALRTHDRIGRFPPEVVNLAHDAVINDIVRHETAWTPIPLRAVIRSEARLESLEELCLDIEMDLEDGTDSWPSETGFAGDNRQAVDERPLTTMERALRDAGLSPDAGPGSDGSEAVAEKADGPHQDEDQEVGGDSSGDGTGRRRRPAAPDRIGDVIDEQRERELFPELDPRDQRRAAAAIDREIARARALQNVIALASPSAPGAEPGGGAAAIEALHGMFDAPWQLVVQR